MKLESKLYNIDKINVANVFLEMQREGQVMANSDFMTDITQRLNLESAKMINISQVDSPKSSKGFLQNMGSNASRQAEEAGTKLAKKSASGMDLTSQLFAFSTFKGAKNAVIGAVKDSGPIPGLDAFQMSDNF